MDCSGIGTLGKSQFTPGSLCFWQPSYNFLLRFNLWDMSISLEISVDFREREKLKFKFCSQAAPNMFWRLFFWKSLDFLRAHSKTIYVKWIMHDKFHSFNSEWERRQKKHREKSFKFIAINRDVWCVKWMKNWCAH